MSDTPPPRRLPVRWLTLAEIVGVAAVVIAGLGYWDSHRERIQQDRERASEASQRQAQLKAETAKPAFMMSATPDKDGAVLRVASVHPEQIIQTQTLWFPAAIRPSSVETTGAPRVEADWLAGGLRKADGKATEGRIPVGVLTVFVEDGQTRTDRSLYQVGYSVHSRMLRGSEVRLEGLSLARRGVDGDLQSAAGALWAAR